MPRRQPRLAALALLVRVGKRDRGDEPLRVRILRTTQDLVARPLLHELAVAQHRDAVGELGVSALPWSDGLSQWRIRVQCLRAWMPELDLPDLSDAALLATRDAWLKPAFAGKTRLDALAGDELAEALKSGIDWNLRQRIDALAPTRIEVPSGMQRGIDYMLDAGGATRMQVRCMGAFEVNDAGKIVRWTDYFDTAAFRPTS